jgi:4,5-epoxidase
MNKAAMQRRVWENLSQLKVTYRNGPLGRQGWKWFSGQGPLPGDRVPDIDCVRAEGGGQTTLHAELGNKWALVMPGRVVSDEHAAVVAKRLGDDAMSMLVADHDANRESMLVRPDAHLGWRGRADPDALDRWLTAVAREGRAG